MRVVTWNVNGIRARLREVVAFTERVRPDVLCLQEIKATADQIDEALFLFTDYASYWHGRPGGYSGVSLHVRKSFAGGPVAFTHPAFDYEARMVQAVTPAATFASVYVPNGGKDYPAKLAFFRALVKHAEEASARGERLVLCGDMNIAREVRDVHPTQQNARLIGQKPEERALFASLLEGGLVDTGRVAHPDDERIFSWWPYWRSARENNIGWRLDYVLASPRLAVRSCAVERETGTSDHAPVIVDLDPGAAPTPRRLLPPQL